MHPVRSVLALVPLWLAAAAPLGAQPLSPPQSLSSEDVAALAVYAAGSSGTGRLPDSLVLYNVTEPATIDAILAGIDLTVQRDCSLLETDNSTHLYVKFKNGLRKVYHLFLLDSHLALASRRVPCFFVAEGARAVLAAHAQ